MSRRVNRVNPEGAALRLGVAPATIKNRSLKQLVQRAISVKIVYAHSPREIYIRTNDMCDRYLKLCEKLRMLVKVAPKRHVRTGHYVAMVDYQWYRACIESFLREGMCKVFLVDAGITVDVQLSDLFKMPPDLCREQLCVIKCAVLHSAREYNNRSKEVFDSLQGMLHTRRQVLFYHVQTSPDGHKVIGDLLLHDWAINMVISVRQLLLNSYDPRSTQDASALVQLLNIGVSTHYEGFCQRKLTNLLVEADDHEGYYQITYAESLDSIYCFPMTFLKFRRLLENILRSFYRDEAPLPASKVVTGMQCVVRHSQTWYRGVVKSIQGNTCRVYAKDIGRTYGVSKDAVWEQFPILEMGALCIRCSVEGIVPPPGCKWPSGVTPVLAHIFQEGRVVKLFKRAPYGGQNRVILSQDCRLGRRLVQEMKNLQCTVMPMYGEPMHDDSD